MKQALYRKYRPQNFDNLSGQSSVKKALMSAFRQKRFVHAYLFSGPRGTGKTSMARLLAKAIQCASPPESGLPCEKCEPCMMANNNELIDLIEIDAASNRGIDEIRDLKDKMRFAPSYAKNKVYIIDEVHMLTKEAFNALLKSLEEPPPHINFILATTELHKIPATIISRCQRYDFKRLNEEDIFLRLKHIIQEENIKADDAALKLIAAQSDGAMRDAISLLEQLSGEEINLKTAQEHLGLGSHEAAPEFYEALNSGNARKALDIIEQIYEKGYDLQSFTIAILELLRRELHENINDREKVEKLVSAVDVFEDTWNRLKKSSMPTLPLEIAVFRLVGMPNKQNSQTKEPENKVCEPESPSIADLKSKWPSICSKLNSAGLKRSMQSATIRSLNNEKLTLAFNAKFHYETANTHVAIADLENALLEILGKKMHVSCVLEEALLASGLDTLGWPVIE